MGCGLTTAVDEVEVPCRAAGLTPATYRRNIERSADASQARGRLQAFRQTRPATGKEQTKRRQHPI